MRAMRIGAQGLGRDLLARLQGFRMHVFTDGPFPDFLWGFNPPLDLDRGGLGDAPHICESEPEILLPGGFLVFDVRVEARGGCRFSAAQSFRPFYTGPILVLHEGMMPDMEVWRPLTGVEAVCGLAQNPWLGSLRFWTDRCRQGAQAYAYCGKIVVDRYESAPGHHMAYAMRQHTPSLSYEDRSVS